MKVNFQVSIFLLIQIPTFWAWSGPDRVRNGGDGVICHREIIYFYDWYELTVVQKKEPLPVSSKIFKDVFKAAKEVINRQPDRDKEFKEMLIDMVDYFKENKRLMGVLPLKPVDDNPDMKLPRSCKPFQAAYSYFDSATGRLRFDVSTYFWTAGSHNMNWENKYTLVLHEIIYALAAQMGHTDSFSVKKVVQHMLTHSSQKNPNSCQLLSLRQKHNLLLPFEVIQLGDLEYPLKKYLVDKNCNISLKYN